MYPRQTELSYRRSALSGASPIGLMIALYDTLSGNLRRAAAAVRNGNIEKRCSELNHALLVLGQLESMAAPLNGEELAGNLAIFYAYLRAKMMEATVQQSAAILEAQIELVLQVRTAWQQRDTAATPLAPVGSLPNGFAYAVAPERVGFSQSI